MTFDKEGGFLSTGDNDGRVVIFSYIEPSAEEKMDLLDQNPDLRGEHIKSLQPKLEYFEEIFAFDPEFNFQKCVNVLPQVTAIEWLNKGYQGRKPQLLVSNEKSIKLYSLKSRCENFDPKNIL